MSKITGIIVAKDHPPYIFQTIDSLNGLTDEIIVVDIGLAPKLKEELQKNRRITINVVNKPVPYVELIREEIKLLAKNEYILMLDPDEIIPPKLASYLIENYPNYDYVSIPRKNIIFNRWICHSRWWPDYQVRLYKKDSVIWPAKIHHQPQTQGRGLTVESKEEMAIIHNNYTNLDQYLTKAMRYAQAEANEIFITGIPYSLASAVKKSLSEFVSRFFAHDGYKDGMHGFALALLQMFYCYLVYFYYWEKKKYKEETENHVKATQFFFQSGLFEINHWLIKKKLSNGITKIKLRLINLLLR